MMLNELSGMMSNEDLPPRAPTPPPAPPAPPPPEEDRPRPPSPASLLRGASALKPPRPAADPAPDPRSDLLKAIREGNLFYLFDVNYNRNESIKKNE